MTQKKPTREEFLEYVRSYAGNVFTITYIDPNGEPTIEMGGGIMECHGLACDLVGLTCSQLADLGCDPGEVKELWESANSEPQHYARAIHMKGDLMELLGLTREEW